MPEGRPVAVTIVVDNARSPAKTATKRAVSEFRRRSSRCRWGGEEKVDMALSPPSRFPEEEDVDRRVSKAPIGETEWKPTKSYSPLMPPMPPMPSLVPFGEADIQQIKPRSARKYFHFMGESARKYFHSMGEGEGEVEETRVTSQIDGFGTNVRTCIPQRR